MKEGEKKRERERFVLFLKEEKDKRSVLQCPSSFFFSI
jgi:hypothetical protein